MRPEAWGGSRVSLPPEGRLAASLLPLLSHLRPSPLCHPVAFPPSLVVRAASEHEEKQSLSEVGGRGQTVEEGGS